jgi:hypothetical protein
MDDKPKHLRGRPLPLLPLIPIADIDFVAPCSADPDAWFVTQNPAMTAYTRRICASCPAQERCQSSGRAGYEHGMWGGETRTGRGRARGKAQREERERPPS